MANTDLVEKLPSVLDLEYWKVRDYGPRRQRLSCCIALIKGCQVYCSSVNTVVIKTERGCMKYEWMMTNLNPHTQDIVPRKLYTLAKLCSDPSLQWVLCKPYPNGELEKVSVLRRLLKGSEVNDRCLDGFSRSAMTNSNSSLVCCEDVVFR